MPTARTTGRAKPARRGGDPIPAAPEPMLCTLLAEPFNHPNWIFEPKYDGLRILARFDGKQVTLLSRYGDPQNVPFPDVVEALGEALDRPAIVDGEVVCFDERGRTSFRELQQRFHLKDLAEVEARRERYPASVYLFDVLYLDGRDVRDLPLRERKELLRKAVRWSERVLWTPYEP